MKQETLAIISGFERYGQKTRRAQFLDEMDQVVPWAKLCALIEPYYPKEGNGRPLVGVERMLRIYFLQQWFNLSDSAVDEALYDSVVMRSFVGIDPGREPVPDETTVRKFRQLLEKHGLGGEMLETVNFHLQNRGLRITTGTIVDPTLLHAPGSTKNREGQRDPEMHQTKMEGVVLRDEGARGSGQQDQAEPHGDSDRSPRGGCDGAAARGRDAGVGRPGVSGADGGHSSVCARGPGLHASALPVQKPVLPYTLLTTSASVNLAATADCSRGKPLDAGAKNFFTEQMARKRHPRRMITREIVHVALDTVRNNKGRFALTALGMMIGTASLILMVTVGLTGKQYVLDQIRGLGVNLIYATYEGEGGNTATLQDYLTVDDVDAVQQQVPGVVAASPMLTLHERISVHGGKEQDVLVLGVDPQYGQIRRVKVLAGRFFDALDQQAHDKVATLTESLAKRLYGRQDAAIGRTLRISGLPFTVIGTFKEGVETFGQSEVSGDTIVIPYRVSRYFTTDNKVHQLFFSMADPSGIEPATAAIKNILQGRHHAESVYRVDNLAQLLTVAANAANALTMVLLLVALITLLVSGVGIMNIMLATVSARTQEIGIRKAVGATAGEIKFQFLAEAVLISLIGGVVGIAVGLALPFSVRFFSDYNIPISGISVVIAIGASSLVGILFGTMPARRAAHMDPIISLHHE